MKKLTFTVAMLLALSLATSSFAQPSQPNPPTSQVPHAIKYQAVARNANGDVISNQNVSFRISIVQGSANGTTVYQETQQATTNQFGLANLSIGRGTATSNSFDDIQWGSDVYFVKIEFDATGGTNYAVMGTSEMLSVPYALYAEKAKSIDGFPVKAALLGTNLAAPLVNPETGFLVYNTDSAGTAPNNVVPGYYYNAGTPTQPNWVSFLGGNRKGVTSVGPVAANNNTTFGGITQDGSGCSGGGPTGLWVGCPSGNFNAGFGTNVFGTGGAMVASFNSALGYEALNSNISANYNTAVGYEALFNEAGGPGGNTAIGTNSQLDMNGGFQNTATGMNSLLSNVGGINNCAYGYDALQNNLSSYNTSEGVASLLLNQNGYDNTAIGFQSQHGGGPGLYTGADNTSLGYLSLYAAGTGSMFNVAVGEFTFEQTAAFTGTNNTVVGNFVADLCTPNINQVTGVGMYALRHDQADGVTGLGYGALYWNQTGVNNTGTGYEASYFNTIGNSNTADGHKALYTNAGGSANTAMGYEALFNNLASTNTAVGDSALVKNTNGTGNVAMGYQAAPVSTTASGITAIGYNSLPNNSDINNTAVGYHTMQSNYIGNNNTALGYQADVGTPGGYVVYSTAIGSGAHTVGSNKMTLGGSGPFNSTSYTFVGIGQASPSADLVIADANQSPLSPATNDHIRSEGAKPTIAAVPGSTFGALAIATNSTDVAGNFTVTTPSTGTPATVQINFSKQYNPGTKPIVLLTATTKAAAKAITQVYVVTSTNNYFQVVFPTVVTGVHTLSYNYFVIETHL